MTKSKTSAKAKPMQDTKSNVIPFKSETVFYSCPPNSSGRDIGFFMDVALFALSPRSKQTEITIQAKNKRITINGGKEGIANINDYDLISFIYANFTKQLNEWEKDPKNSQLKPKKHYTIELYKFFKFANKQPNGDNYRRMRTSLQRLIKTTIFVEKLSENATEKHYAGQKFSWISKFDFVENKLSQKETTLRIQITDELYNLMLAKGTKSMLGLPKSYYQLKSTLEKFIFRLSRKMAGNGNAKISIKELYMRSGSEREYRKFKADIKGLVKRNPLPDYRLDIYQNTAGDEILAISRHNQKSLFDEASPDE